MSIACSPHQPKLARQTPGSYQVIVQLIGATTTDTGLTVTCDIDGSQYRRGIKISKADMAAINIQPHAFHGDWNYTIRPNQHPP